MSAFSKTVLMMVIALPTMFVVIGFLMLATKLLHKCFPVTAEPEDAGEN